LPPKDKRSLPGFNRRRNRGVKQCPLNTRALARKQSKNSFVLILQWLIPPLTWSLRTQDTRHKTQDTRHKTQDTRHKTLWERSSPCQVPDGVNSQIFTIFLFTLCKRRRNYTVFFIYPFVERLIVRHPAQQGADKHICSKSGAMCATD